MPTLNIGILAHVDAGKTSLTERLLFDTGAITALGSVDAGTTRTDTGLLERQRGITVRAAVASFALGRTRINVIDTPGHADFVAEVDRALELLDAAILVISAVEGVQAQTRVLMRVLRELGVPVLIFVNKIDRVGARYADLVDEIRKLLAIRAIPLTRVEQAGTSAARIAPIPITEHAETLAEVDDAILTGLLDGPAPTATQLVAARDAAIGRGELHPIHFGSALSGAGTADLLDTLARIVPPQADPTAPADGVVFAMDRSTGPKRAYLRLFSGTVHARERLTLRHTDGTEYTGHVTRLDVVPAADHLEAGQIAVLTGLAEVRVGDRLAGSRRSERGTAFGVPDQRTLVRSDTPQRLHAALRQLADQDPLLDLRTEPDGAATLALRGEIQQQIIAATLAHEFGLTAHFAPSTPPPPDRVLSIAEAAEEMGYRAPCPSGFWASLGLRVAPGPPGSGIDYRSETERGALPRAFHTAIEVSVRAALAAGPNGRPVTDCVVTVLRTGFAGPVTTAADFRGLTPIILHRAIRRAGTDAACIAPQSIRDQPPMA
ncbi:GTP-binding protein [Nocardia panacis]|uniref:GTP-binding protein n=1 Tax=Nocardia panacis TaxID=2340916 RepID=A0A3A4K8E7_9NOCA|nr:GTP-binding protein [Nocardia panacis]RJO70957.1 GTP-binding protein [Nocardia panacis]